MLTRYCLVALAALSVIVEAAGGDRRSRNVNIRKTNSFTPRSNSHNSNNRVNVNSRFSKLSNKRQVTIKPKKLSFSNKQRFASQSNRKKSHTNSNSGLQNNNFAKSIVKPVKNHNRINAHHHAKVEDNEQGSHQTVKSGTLGINGNIQSNGGNGIVAIPLSASTLSAPAAEPEAAAAAAAEEEEEEEEE